MDAVREWLRRLRNGHAGDRNQQEGDSQFRDR
jgi:hypothetical protein